MDDISNTITIDWESFYSQDFSLTKMTTQEYVMSPYFQAIGIGVKLNDQPTEWFSGTHEEIQVWLQHFPWDDAVVIAHNANFDAAILEWIFDIHPVKWFCTMQASRPLYVPWTWNGRMSLKIISEHLGIGEKGTEVINALGMRREDFSPDRLQAYGEYCKNDTELCYKIYCDQSSQLPQMEMDLIDATVKKYVRPVFHLDLNVLTERLAIVKAEKEEVLASALLVDNAVLMSNPKFAEALETLGVVPPLKVSPATGKETYAFAKNDPEFKELLDHPDARVQALVAARLKHKSTQEETRLARFIALAHTDAPFGVPLLYYGAHTGRFSGLDKLNLQNLPRGGALRAAMIAPPGYKVVAGDLSQIEARILATLAGQDDLVEQFRAGKDVYSIFASRAFGYTCNKKDHPTERFVGKTCILGLGYQVGAEKLQTTLKVGGVEITLDTAWKYVNTYRRGYAKIPLLWRKADELIKFMMSGDSIKFGPLTTMKDAILLPNGMRLNYPDLRLDGKGSIIYTQQGKDVYLYGGKLVENIVQALARIVVAEAEIWLYRRGWLSALQVHDELVYVVLEGIAEKFGIVLEKALTRQVSWMKKLPVAAEVGIGDNYAEAK